MSTESARKWQKKNPKRAREHAHKWQKIHGHTYYIANREKMILRLAKTRALAKGITFNIEPSDIVVPGECPLLGIPLIIGTGGGLTDNSPSIDRIDSTKGYEKGNVWVISGRANRIKNDATPEELMRIATLVWEKTRR